MDDDRADNSDDGDDGEQDEKIGKNNRDFGLCFDEASEVFIDSESEGTDSDGKKGGNDGYGERFPSSN